MPKCLCNCGKCVQSCFKGLLRLVLFLACLTIAIFTLINLIIRFTLAGTEPDTEYMESLNLHKYYSSVILSILSLIISLTGCYGAFFKHQPSIKFFSWSTAIIVAITMLSLISTSPEYLRKENDKYFAEMKDKMDKYDWNRTSESAETESWDILQASLECCGINGKNDWDEYRPSFMRGATYPPSCCPFGNNCDDTRGCREEILKFEKFIIMVTVYFTCGLLVLCVISCVVGHLEFDSSTPSPPPNSLESGDRGLQPNSNIQRQGSSAYLRQPSFNESFTAPDSNRNPLPQIYPNAHDIEKKTQLPAPPPSYGSAK